MMHLRPDDPLWKSRALRLAELMRDRWTGRNLRGLGHFKSIYFSASRVDDSPQRAFDTVYHPSIVQPALLYFAQRLIGERRHNLEVHQIAPLQRELGEGLGVIAFQEIVAPLKSHRVQRSSSLTPLGGWPPVFLNRAIASSRAVISGFQLNVSINFFV
jgi:hypothetical protein